MKRKGFVILISLAFVCSTLFACGSKDESDSDSSIKTHTIKLEAGSDDYVGNKISDVTRLFQEQGFENVESIPIDDLSSKGNIPDGAIESVSINGASFEKGDKIEQDSPVTITYHTFKRFAFPFTEETVNSVSLNAVNEMLLDTGFTDVSVSELTDLDPDLYDQDQVTLVFVDGVEVQKPFSGEHPFDGTILVERHYTYPKYNLNLKISFPGNLIFDKYDVTVKVDGDTITTLPHGSGWEGTIRLRDGEYTMNFEKSDDSSVCGQIQFIVSEDTDANFSISCFGTYVSAKSVYYQPQLTDDMVRMNYGESRFLYRDYNDAINDLRNLGFTNIKTSILYDIVWGITPNGETASVSIAGNRNYTNGDRFNKDDEVIVTYHMPYDDNPNLPTATPIPTATPVPTATPTPTIEPKPTVAPKTEMPVMVGSSLKSVTDMAKKYGVTEKFEDDFGHDTRSKALSDSSGGLMMNVIYSSKTNEILCATIVTNNLVSAKQQQDFIKAMASVLCPSSNSAEVNAWVAANVGNEKSTRIGGFTYEVELGPVNNALYYAGYKEWESWDMQYW